MTAKQAPIGAHSSGPWFRLCAILAGCSFFTSAYVILGDLDWWWQVLLAHVGITLLLLLGLWMWFEAGEAKVNAALVALEVADPGGGSGSAVVLDVRVPDREDEHASRRTEHADE